MSEPGTEVRRRTVDLLKKATDLLEERGVISPRLNAETLLAEATGMTRVELYTSFDKPVSPAETDRFRALIKRRLAHEPLQYITGRRGFRHLSLRVSPAVLIPRPETELLVERALQKMEEDPRLTVVLDLGTGSGCIALSVAQENPRAEVHASDISGEALEVAGLNAEENGLEDRVCFHAGDLFGPLPDRLRGGVHLVLSNPPLCPRAGVRGTPPGGQGARTPPGPAGGRGRHRLSPPHPYRSARLARPGRLGDHGGGSPAGRAGQGAGARGGLRGGGDRLRLQRAAPFRGGPAGKGSVTGRGGGVATAICAFVL